MERAKEGMLYLKYRPHSLDEIVGNEGVVEILRNQLQSKSVPRSLLFHGPTGCGKTTLARIVARELGVKGRDLKEIDSADFRGIDTVREIRKQSAYSPMEGPCVAFILDECHRLTGDAQSALLKALEDTPKHVYYMLCTTEPQKLLPTIRGRCAQYQVRTLAENEMRHLLRKVVKAEGESLPREVYEQIIQDSLGHPRNALQVLAQVLAVEEGKRLSVAKRAAETQSKTVELCRALVEGAPWGKVARILQGLREEDPEQVRRAVLGYGQAVLLKESRNDRVAAVMEVFASPFYDTGFPGLVLACYSALFGGGD